jgi:hypothetical protein
VRLFGGAFLFGRISMLRLKALVPFYYDKRDLKENEQFFAASDEDARVLKLINKAADVEEESYVEEEEPIKKQRAFRRTAQQ